MPLPKILFFSLGGAIIGGIRGYLSHRKKLERQRRESPAPRALPTAPLLPMTSGPAWGWVWSHSAATGERGLGYFFVDSTHGPSLRLFADLRSQPDEATLRAEIALRLASGGAQKRLGPYRLVTTDDPDPGRANEARALFEAGRDREGLCDTILLRVSLAERELLAIPERPTFVDALF